MCGSNSFAPAVPEALPEPLTLTVHSVAAPSAGDPARRTRSGRLKMLLVLAVCAAPVVASYLTYFVIKPDTRSNYGALITPVRAMPGLALTALDGSPVAASTLKGQWLLVVAAPSRCEAACEGLLFVQRQLREMLGRERTRVDKVWLVTDAGAVNQPLREALASVPAMHILRADAVAVAQWLAPEMGHALQDHLYVVDPQGNWMMRMPAAAEPARVKRDLERLLRASASWDRAGRP